MARVATRLGPEIVSAVVSDPEPAVRLAWLEGMFGGYDYARDLLEQALAIDETKLHAFMGKVARLLLARMIQHSKI